MNNPPQGSKIRIESERGYEKITVPQGNGGPMRYLVGLFLLAWLGGWTIGLIAAFTALVSGKESDQDGFLLFWIVGWAIGGVFAIRFAWRILQPSVPEQLLLTVPTLSYDTGIQPFTLSLDYRDQMDTWKKLFKKRKKEQFSVEEIRTLRLREFENGNRLTLDKGVERIDIGASLTDIEREWLFNFLAQKYNIEQVASSQRH